MASSSACRDWLKTLWPASYKGVPFFFEQDKEKGGRDTVDHVFPHRDDPFIEDMGEALRIYSGSAYVHGDNADALANALKAALASRGAGTLVVPYFGPVTVHCKSFERATQRDQMGYVAFELEFVRAGAASAFVSVPLLQNLAFGAADALSVSLGQLFPRTIAVLDQMDYVVSAVTDTLGSAAATIEVLRQSYPVDPKVSADVRDNVAGFVTSLPAAISNISTAESASAAAATLIAIVRQFADGLPAPSAARATLEFIDAFSQELPTTTGIVVGRPYTPTLRVAADNAAATARLVRLAGLTAYAEAVLRQSFPSRPDAVTARGELAERFENELYDTTGAANAPLYVAIEKLRGTVIEWLTREIATLAPVITVESARIMPALALAWTLYADPLRSDELVARNRARHPSFMPRVISALSR
jgi:prophage DNA circulation protein